MTGLGHDRLFYPAFQNVRNAVMGGPANPLRIF